VSGRLLLVLTVPMRGGAEDYALTIARAATAQGWSVHAALPFARGTETLCRDLRAAGIGLSPIASMDGPAGGGPQPRVRAKLRAAVRFARIARRFRPDVIHITLPWPTFGFVLRLTSALLGLPTLVVFQLVRGGLIFRRRRRLAYRWTRSRNQRWIAVSDHGRHLIGALYRMDPAAIGVIHNGARPAPSEVDGEARDRRASVRAELGLQSDATMLLSVGRLDQQKGQADLLCAVAGVHSERPDVRLVVAGDGPERERLEELISALGLQQTVRLLGHRRDVEHLMDAADLFVFPSHFEGTPFAMLEAMAHGLPVVATAFGGAEEILDDGRTGILVPVGRPDALRAAIIAALAGPQRLARLAAAGRERAAGFSEEAMIAATMHELERLRTS
jgi:glycosyltransferase involved in cell wall biosynthesis